MISALITIGIVVGIVVGAMMWAAKKAADAVAGKSATEALKDVTNANRPLSDPELERVRQSYKRD